MATVRTARRVIFLMRHGEKPDAPPLEGVDLDGDGNSHSLVPRGWQRAGALAALFAPFDGALRSGVSTPTELISPGHGDKDKVAGHRTYQTIVPLSELIGVEIDTTYEEGDEEKLGEALAAAASGVTLVSWDHTAIPTIANNITPIVPGTVIPQSWPDHRYDVIWSFTLDPDTGAYEFGQVPEMLLAGDSTMPISP